MQADSAVEQITAALAWWGPEGTPWTRNRAQEQLRQASEHLPGSQWDKVRRVLRDERTLRHLDRRHEQRTDTVSDPLVREALIHVWPVSEAMRQAEGDTHVRLHHAVVMQQVVCQRLCAQWEPAEWSIHLNCIHTLPRSFPRSLSRT